MFYVCCYVSQQEKPLECVRVCLLSCVITRNLFMSRKKRSNNSFAHLRLFHVGAFFAVLYEIIANQSFSNLIPSKIKYLSRKRIDLNKFSLFHQMFLKKSIFLTASKQSARSQELVSTLMLLRSQNEIYVKYVPFCCVLFQKVLH